MASLASLRPCRGLALALALALAGTALGCAGDAAEPAGDTPGGPAPTPEPAAAGPAATPAPTPAGGSRLTVSGDVNFDDLDPEVVVFDSGGGLKLELRHRVPGSASPDSTLVLFDLPARGGSYRLVSPRAAGRGAVGALFTTRSERVGSMKDFDHGISGSLTLREESPGVFAGSFEAELQEAPPPPPPPPRPGEPPLSAQGKVPPKPPARVTVGGTLVAVLAAARAEPTPPPGAATPASAGR